MLQPPEQRLNKSWIACKPWESNKQKPQALRIRRLGQTFQHDEVVNPEVRLKANCLDQSYAA